jgi:hypothetical protein
MLFIVKRIQNMQKPRKISTRPVVFGAIRVNYLRFSLLAYYFDINLNLNTMGSIYKHLVFN